MTEQSATRQPRLLWLRVAMLILCGGLLLLIISAVDAGDECTSRLSAPVLIGALAVVLVSVVGCTYALLRRAARSRHRALLLALGMVPASYAVAIIVLLIVVRLL
jgi:hypothetical protein